MLSSVMIISDDPVNHTMLAPVAINRYKESKTHLQNQLGHIFLPNELILEQKFHFNGKYDINWFCWNNMQIRL